MSPSEREDVSVTEEASPVPRTMQEKSFETYFLQFFTFFLQYTSRGTFAVLRTCSILKKDGIFLILVEKTLPKIIKSSAITIINSKLYF